MTCIKIQQSRFESTIAERWPNRSFSNSGALRQNGVAAKARLYLLYNDARQGEWLDLHVFSVYNKLSWQDPMRSADTALLLVCRPEQLSLPV